MEQENETKLEPELENPALKCPKCDCPTLTTTDNTFWCPVCDGYNATDEAWSLSLFFSLCDLQRLFFSQSDYSNFKKSINHQTHLLTLPPLPCILPAGLYNHDL